MREIHRCRALGVEPIALDAAINGASATETQCCSAASAAPRPICLDLHTYRHQEPFLRQPHSSQRHLRSQQSSGYNQNKENFQVPLEVCQRNGFVRAWPSVVAHRHHQLRQHASSTCNNNNDVDRFRAIEKRIPRHHYRFPTSSAGKGAEKVVEPVDLDVFSSPSSFSDDDDDDDDDAGHAEIYYGSGTTGTESTGAGTWYKHRRRRHNAFYSTSDLTTSDSEICRYPTLPLPSKRGSSSNLATKFPSLSTIYPNDNNSSMSFDDYAEEYRNNRYDDRHHHYLHHRHQHRTATTSLKQPDMRKSNNNSNNNNNGKVVNDRSVDSSSLLSSSQPDTERLGQPSYRRNNHYRSSSMDDNEDQPSTSSSLSDDTPPLAVSVSTTPAHGIQRTGTLEMIEEISPVLPAPADANDDMDLPPMIQPLKLSKEWKPIQTSTLTDFHRGVGAAPPIHPRYHHHHRSGGVAIVAATAAHRIPKTNPRHMGSLTRHSAMVLPPSTPKKAVGTAAVESRTPPPLSLFDPHYQDLSQTCPPDATHIRPEQFNLPAQLAKQLDVKGILYLNITIVGWTLVVTAKNAAYFFKDRPPVSSCVKVELKRNKAYRKRTKYDSRFKSYRSCVVPQTMRPDFYEEFKFRVSWAHLKLGDKLGITVYATNSADPTEFSPREVIGRMCFSLRKLFKKANLNHDRFIDDMPDPVKVCDGGYFLLPEKTGSESHLSQDNILHQKYYDEIGSTTFSTTSSLQSGSPLKMMSEPEWRASHAGGTFKIPPLATASAELYAVSKSGTGGGSPSKKSASTNHHLINLHHVIANRFGGCSNGGGGGGSMTAAVRLDAAIGGGDVEYTKTQPQMRKCSANAIGTVKSEGNGMNLLDYTVGSSGSSSGGTSDGIEYKRRHRCTLPSITTTITDTTTSDYSNGDSLENNRQELQNIDYHFLYANNQATSGTTATTDEISGGGMRRDTASDENEEEEDFHVRPQTSQQPAESNKENHQRDGNATTTTRLLLRKERPSSTKQKRKDGVDAKEKSSGTHTSVRRVASFTYSPQGSTDKHNKRDAGVYSATANGGTTVSRKFTLGPIGKTLNYLRSKVDTAISTSALYPTREECRLWQESFEALLNHKYGCLLFRQFLKQEFSIENLEFWLECEEYKKLKETKKTKIKQRADSIYNTYVADGAVKEVNLDSTTKMATKAALENGATPDLFNLAQGKIEQLMAKDSYQRFLKSENYLELLNGPPLSASAAEDAADSVILRTGTNRDAALAKQQRQAACAARRHTCVPEQSETLAIQELAVRKMALKNDGDGMKVPGARNASIAEHVDAK